MINTDISISKILFLIKNIDDVSQSSGGNGKHFYKSTQADKQKADQQTGNLLKELIFTCKHFYGFHQDSIMHHLCFNVLKKFDGVFSWLRSGFEKTPTDFGEYR